MSRSVLPSKVRAEGVYKNGIPNKMIFYSPKGNIQYLLRCKNALNHVLRELPRFHVLCRSVGRSVRQLYTQWAFHYTIEEHNSAATSATFRLILFPQPRHAMTAAVRFSLCLKGSKGGEKRWRNSKLQMRHFSLHVSKRSPF